MTQEELKDVKAIVNENVMEFASWLGFFSGDLHERPEQSVMVGKRVTAMLEVIESMLDLTFGEKVPL